MDPNKGIARIVGGLFITGTVAGILSVVFSGAILDDPNYLSEVAKNENRMIAGALCVLIMAVALAMIPVVLFPVFRKFNEAIALGAVIFRGALEAVAYFGIVISWFLLIILSKAYNKAEGPDVTALKTLGILLIDIGDGINQVLAIVFSIGALMIYYLFYISRLVPRWLSAWGLVGSTLYLIYPIMSMFGAEYGILMVPLAVQEMVLAIWLIVKGFQSTPMRPEYDEGIGMV